MANQSPPPSPFSGQTRHVFLSFRRRDIRRTFAAALHDALWRKGIDAEKNSRSSSAIRSARISIVVFSENYASSRRCLCELSKILRCMSRRNQLVLPIFYGVDPSDVRHQRKRFGEAMAAHEGRFGRESDKVQGWRSALREAAGLSGWHLQPGYEHKFIERIAEEISKKLPPKRTHITEHIVGLKFRIEELKSRLDDVSGNNNNNVCMLGIGKTTLAKALYNLIFHQFDGACFLSYVKEISKQYGGGA